jgi:uncharacterized cupredoxin-like copper-binding protein
MMLALLLFLVFVPSLTPPALAAEPVLFAAYDYGYSGPESVPAGVSTVEILNQGQDLHHAQLIRLARGKTAGDFQQALKTDPRIPDWALLLGGPNAVVPSERARAIVNLEPGNYLVVCWIPDKDNTPHVALGMARPFKVRGKAQVSELPIGDVHVDEGDFSFAATANIAPGHHVVRVRNNGAQPHEVLLVQLPPDGSIAEFGEAVAKGVDSPPPGKPIGGITGLQPGSEAVFTADLTPGKYGLICFFPDEEGALHFSRGMMTEVTVPPK